jgi:DNA transformation protein
VLENIMAVSDTFRTFVLDQLGQIVPGVRGRAMFGGLGIYAGERFFALIARETLHLKASELSRADFKALGARPFQPFPDRAGTMSYYEVPLDVLESVPKLRPLVEQALAATTEEKPKRKAARSTKTAKKKQR